MKIGIITWFSGLNYGTNLQAIALQRFLRNMGHDVEIVNYEVQQKELEQTLWEKLTDKKMIWTRIRRQPQKYAMKYAVAKYGKQIKERDRKLSAAVKKLCILTTKIRNESQLIRVLNRFELLICGSDQIWNPRGYHRFYYADYDDVRTRRISYAPSLGVNSILEEKIPEIKRSLSKFNAVSVREQKGADLLSPLMEKRPVVVIDPTLLMDEDDWEKVFHVKESNIKENGNTKEESHEKYVLSMFLTDNSSHWKAAGKFAKRKELRHIVIPYCGFSYLQKAEIKADAGLQEFLDLIRGAEYVLTDSFHVTVFSLIMHKQFYTFTRFREDAYTSQNARVKNILSLAKLEGRLLPYGKRTVPDIKTIDYKVVDQALGSEIDKSKKFLMMALQGGVE